MYAKITAEEALTAQLDLGNNAVNMPTALLIFRITALSDFEGDLSFALD